MIMYRSRMVAAHKKYIEPTISSGKVIFSTVSTVLWTLS